MQITLVGVNVAAELHNGWNNNSNGATCSKTIALPMAIKHIAAKTCHAECVIVYSRPSGAGNQGIILYNTLNWGEMHSTAIIINGQWNAITGPSKPFAKIITIIVSPPIPQTTMSSNNAVLVALEIGFT